MWNREERREGGKIYFRKKSQKKKKCTILSVTAQSVNDRQGATLSENEEKRQEKERGKIEMTKIR